MKTPVLSASGLAVATGFFAMLLIGWKLADSTEPPVAAPPAASQRSAARASHVAPGKDPRESARRRVADIRALALPDDRVRAGIALAQSLPLSEIRRWLDEGLFPGGEGVDAWIFNKLLLERWQLEDPCAKLAWTLGKDPRDAPAVLREMLKTDPQGTLAYLKEQPNTQLQLEVLAGLAESDPALVLQALGMLSFAHYSDEPMASAHSYEIFENLVQSSPAALEAVLAGLPVEMRQMAEGKLIQSRLESSFGTEIRKLWERPDGWELFSKTTCCGTDDKMRLFGELANMPPAWRGRVAEGANTFIDSKTAEQWCTADLEGFGFTPTQAMRIREEALFKMFGADPETSLRLMGEYKLSSCARMNIISCMFPDSKWDRERVENLIALLPTEEERKTAREKYDQNVAEQEKTKIEQPADWLAKVIDSATPGSITTALRIDSWDTGRIAELTTQFKNLPDAQKQRVAEFIRRNSNAFSGLPVVYSEALLHLVANPSPSVAQSISNEAGAFAASWVKEDVSAACEWVRRFPAGEAKLWAQKRLADSLMGVDSDAADRWLSSLPVAEREQVKALLEKDRTPKP